MKHLKLITSLLAFAVLLGCSSEVDFDLVGTTHVDTNSEYHITLTEALDNADKFFAKLSESSTRSPRIVKSVENLLPFTRSNDSDKMNFYIVNYEGGGFALLAADTRAKASVYAFSEDGSMNMSDTIDNIGLKNYLASITTPDPSNATPVIDLDKYYKIIKNVPPMASPMVSKWYQTSPYNKYCFTKDNKQAVVGCVALATAQAMSIMKWPPTWPYPANIYSEHYSFDWEEIQNTECTESLCHLLEVLGRSDYLDMTYGEEGSSGSLSYISRCPKALKGMKYDNATYSDKFILSTVLNELDDNVPVILRGQNPNEDAGHAWITDGYYTYVITQPLYPTPEPKYYIHFVWGWFGKSNGFYLYDADKDGFGPDSSYAEENDIFPTLQRFYGNIRMVYGFRPNRNLY